MLENLRRFAFWLILIPVSVLLIAFALANSQRIFLSLDPFSSTATDGVELPLFLICVLFFVGGALIGAFLTWNAQRPWRSTVRRQAKEIEAVRDELNLLKRGVTPAPAKPDWQILPPL